MSKINALLAPFGAVSNAIGFEDAIERPINKGNVTGSWLEKGGDIASNGAGFFSSGVGTVGVAGEALYGLGATAAGGSLTAAASGLGSAALVAGAGAGGYALGQFFAEHTFLGDVSTAAVGAWDRKLSYIVPGGDVKTNEGDTKHKRSPLSRAAKWLEDL